MKDIYANEDEENLPLIPLTNERINEIVEQSKKRIEELEQD